MQHIRLAPWPQLCASVRIPAHARDHVSIKCMKVQYPCVSACVSACEPLVRAY